MPCSDLRVPLNDMVESPILVPRVRRGTVGSEDFNEKAAKLRIDVDSDKKRHLRAGKLSRTLFGHS